jgi:hypothetical protein
MAKRKKAASKKGFVSKPAPEGETRADRDERLAEEQRVTNNKLAHQVSPQAGDELEDKS